MFRRKWKNNQHFAMASTSVAMAPNSHFMVLLSASAPRQQRPTIADAGFAPGRPLQYGKRFIMTSRKPQTADRRRGVTVLIVLGVLSITLALSYAMLRSQFVSVQIQQNAGRRGEARQAAQTGLAIALRKMHQADWQGVDTTVSADLGDGTSFSAEYVTGDASLSSGDDDYWLYPYRVTVTATGYAQQPGAAGSPAQHQVQAVVQLLPRQLSASPGDWTSLQDYTVYQWADQPVVCETPVRLEGRTRLHGELQLCEDYPPTSRPWEGRIDEAAIFATALTPAEIQAIYLAGSTADGTLPALYTASVPQHWWRLNEPSGTAQAADAGTGGAMGSYENGAAPGQTGPPIGVTNGAAAFDGRNDHINVGAVDVAGDQMTVLAWFYAESFAENTDARILSKATGTATDEHYWMLSTTRSSGQMRLRFRMRSSGWTKTLIASSGDIQTGQWYFAAAVYDGVDMRLYQNGVEVGSGSKTGVIDIDPTVSAFIGDNPPGSPRARYLRDLEAMRSAGLTDNRPFDGPVELPFSRTSDATLALLQSYLNVTAQDVTPSGAAPIAHPGAPAAYRLYSGGKLYKIPDISTADLTADLQPDAIENPLGVHLRRGGLSILDGVSVTGTLITDGADPDLNLAGDDISISAVALPPLHGTTTPVQLPAVIIADDLAIGDHPGSSIAGAAVVADEFRFAAGSQTAQCAMQGRLVAQQLRLEGRTEWNAVTSSQWESRLTTFISQLSSGTAYFPDWLSTEHGLNSQPQLTISPPIEEVTYHWHDWNNPVFIPHPDDDGLRWELIRRIDSP